MYTHRATSCVKTFLIFTTISSEMPQSILAHCWYKNDYYFFFGCKITCFFINYYHIKLFDRHIFLSRLCICIYVCVHVYIIYIKNAYIYIFFFFYSFAHLLTLANFLLREFSVKFHMTIFPVIFLLLFINWYFVAKLGSLELSQILPSPSY